MEDNNLPQDVADQTKSVDESRRHFTKAGMAVSGVLLTLASRSALGDVVCKSPSGFLSGNVSAHGTPLTCNGLTPGYWGTHGGGGPQPNVWPSPHLPGTCPSGKWTKTSNWSGGTPFKNVFHTSGYGSKYKNYTLMQVIWLGGGGDPYQLGAHIVAALLNAASGKTLGVLTVAQVINIFNEYDLKGYYQPTAGVKWYPADIVAYLKSTMS